MTDPESTPYASGGNIAPLASRRRKVQRPAAYDRRVEETLAALESLRGDAWRAATTLRPFYPSPAALQLYLLDDPTALGSARYVAQPQSSVDTMREMLTGLEAASVWVDDRLDDSYSRDFGMRAALRHSYDLLSHFAVYELLAMRRNREMTNARMQRVADLWQQTTLPESLAALRQLTSFERTLSLWRQNYRRALNSARPELIADRATEGEGLTRTAYSRIYRPLFLAAIDAVADGPPTPPRERSPPLDLGPERSEMPPATPRRVQRSSGATTPIRRPPRRQVVPRRRPQRLAAATTEPVATVKPEPEPERPAIVPDETPPPVAGPTPLPDPFAASRGDALSLLGDDDDDDKNQDAIKPDRS